MRGELFLLATERVNSLCRKCKEDAGWQPDELSKGVCFQRAALILNHCLCGAGHTDAVRALAISDDRLFSGSYDGTVKVWDTETLECLKTLAGHTGPVRTLVSSAGHMFSGSYDKTVSSACRLHTTSSA